MQSDNPVRDSSQGSIILSDKVLVGILVASLSITLTYVRSLIYFDTPSIVFDRGPSCIRGGADDYSVQILRNQVLSTNSSPCALGLNDEDAYANKIP